MLNGGGLMCHMFSDVEWLRVNVPHVPDVELWRVSVPHVLCFE